ncbi:MAG: tetratricopeptide repeat protein [Arcobacteraceae bacterium]|nr:tetratricopeptide repeat protein [Arcobacteraceae bacterium]
MTFTKLIEKASKRVGEKNYKEAVKLYKKALPYEPNNKKIYFNLGVVYLHLEEFYNAIENFKKALSLDKDYVSAYSNLAICYKKIKEYHKTINCLFKALQLSKTPDVDIYYNLGNTLSSIEEYSKAISYFDKVIEIDPTYYKAYHAKGLVFNHLTDYKKALWYFKKTLEYKSDYSDSIFAISLIELRNGDFINGWEHYESRFEATNPLKKLSYELPFYNGENITNKTILIQEEQGFGDNIQFIRYIELIKKENPKKIYVAVRKELIRVFELIDGINVVTNADILYDIDFVVSLLSMPRIFKTTLETIPINIPYLRVSLSDDISFQIIQNTKKIKVGFAYQGNKEHKNDNYRSIPLEIFKTLFTLEDVEFYSLQIGENKELLKIQNEYHNVFDCNEIVSDFHDSGQILSHLDFIITIDSALAHFSGALGKITYLLLSQNSEWRWLESRVDSPWYPSVTIFRQKELGMWGEVIDEVQKKLENNLLIKKQV